jgi:RNA polymerase sigma factor (sigma-70 family)
MTDEELLLQYQTGDALAFTQLVENHGDHLYSFVQNQVRNQDLAHDIIQDVWVRLILKSEDICRRIEAEGEAFQLKPYLYRMAVNRVTDYWRRNQRLTRLDDGDTLLDTDATPPLRLLSRDELLACVALRMRDITLRKQQAFWQTRDGRMTYAELAGELGVAMETVKDWVRQVMRAIRPCREDFDNA